MRKGTFPAIFAGIWASPAQATPVFWEVRGLSVKKPPSAGCQKHPHLKVESMPCQLTENDHFHGFRTFPAIPAPPYLNPRSRRLFKITDTLLRDIATLAIMGLSSQPVKG